MPKKILIDLMKCRNCKDCTISCAYPFHDGNNGMKNIREIAAFHITCRKCEDSPCIEVCPAKALEKNENKIIRRASNLCVACKSCVTICPFGTLMNDFFEYCLSVCNYCNFSEETLSLECIDTCPEKAISLTDMEENEKENIFALNDRILIKDYTWEKLKHETEPLIK